MNKLAGLFIFACGAAVGSVVTWQYTKRMYEQLAQEEIDSVKEVFARKTPDMEIRVGAEPEETSEDEKEPARIERYEGKPDISQYAKILKEEQYATDDDSPVTEEKPYVISPDEFGEFDYEQVSLTYYADQVLADDNNQVIENVDEIVGVESLTHFGEYEDDSVFVRNDRLRCDYEILMDTRTYADVRKTMPHSRED